MLGDTCGYFHDFWEAFFLMFCCCCFFFNFFLNMRLVWPNLVPTWWPKWKQNRSKYHPKTKKLKYWKLAPLWDGIDVFRGPGASKISFFSFQDLQKTAHKKKRQKYTQQFNFWCKKMKIGPQDGSKGGREGVQNSCFLVLSCLLGPNWGPRPSKRLSWSHLGTILVPFCMNFGAILVTILVGYRL